MTKLQLGEKLNIQQIHFQKKKEQKRKEPKKEPKPNEGMEQTLKEGKKKKSKMERSSTVDIISAKEHESSSEETEFKKKPIKKLKQE